MSRRRLDPRALRGIRRLAVASLIAGLLFAGGPGAASAEPKPALILATKDVRLQPALKKICDRANQGDLAVHYRDVVWLVHTVDTPPVVNRLAPGDATDQVTDQLFALAATQTQVQSCQQRSQPVRLERPVQFLLLEIVGSKLAGDDTIAIRLMRAPDAPEPHSIPLEYAYHTDLGDPVDVEKFAGCLAWQLWDLRQWLHASPSCRNRGLKVEPAAPTPPATNSEAASNGSDGTRPRPGEGGPVLPFDSATPTATPPATASAVPASTASADPRWRRWSNTTRNLVIGVGAIGVLAGSVFGLRALKLAEGCPDCPEERYDRAMVSAHVSTAGFVVGIGAGLALGYQLALAHRGSPSSGARQAPPPVALWLSGDGGGQIRFGGVW